MKKLLFLIAAVMMTCFSITTFAAEEFNVDDYYLGDDLTEDDVYNLINSVHLDNYGNETGEATVENKSYAIYESLCRNYGYQLSDTTLEYFDQNENGFDAMPLRPQTLDNFILVQEDYLEHKIDSAHSTYTGDIKFGYFFSKHRITEYIGGGVNIFSYIDEEDGCIWYIDNGLSYEYRTGYIDLRLKQSFKYNTGASSFSIENAFMMKSDVPGLLKITLNYYEDGGVLFVCEASDNLEEIKTYSFEKEMNKQTICYIPVDGVHPILLGAQHNGNALSINSLEFFSLGEGTEEQIKPFNYTSGVLPDDEIMDQLYNTSFDEGYGEGHGVGYEEGYDHGYDTGFSDGEDLHVEDFNDGYDEGFDAGYVLGNSDGYSDGKAYGEELHKDDYSNGYSAGQEYGESLHVNDYQNGYTEGYNKGLKDGEALHTNDYKNGYDAGLSAGEDLHAEDFNDGYKKGYNDGYNAAKLDSNVPSINALNIVVGNSKELTLDEIKALFTYSDNDNNNEDLVFEITTNEYSKNYKTPGNYKVVGTIMDPSGNRSAATAIITVYDEVLPKLEAYSTEAIYNKALSFDQIKDLFIYSDDVTLYEDIIFEIVSDKYTANYNTIGEYNIVARVTDSTGNQTTATAVIKVIDNIDPIVCLPEVITTSATNPISLNEIKNIITVYDTYDKNINFELEALDNYNNPGVGSYKFKLTATDLSNNTITCDFVVEVVENITSLDIENINIIIEKDDSLSKDQIKKYASKALSINESDIQIVSGEYDITTSDDYELSILLNDGTLANLIIHVNGNVKSINYWLWALIGLGIIAFATTIIIFIKKRN